MAPVFCEGYQKKTFKIEFSVLNYDDLRYYNLLIYLNSLLLYMSIFKIRKYMIYITIFKTMYKFTYTYTHVYKKITL